MAAVAATIPSWDITRKKRCFQQFIKLKCVKDSTKKLNADAVDFDITQLDEKKMKAHILDCVAALGIVQQELVSQEQPSILRGGEQSLAKVEQEASNKVFKASLSIAASAMLHDGSDVPLQSESVDSLLRAFPNDLKQTDGRSWLPLHWAVVVGEKSVTEEDVKEIYASDPMALQRHHLEGSSVDDMGFTPAHMLCIQEMTNRNMSFIRLFSICNEQAFIMSASYSSRGDPLLYGYSALHGACDLGQPAVELLKQLLQLSSSQTQKKCRENGFTPLGYLCKNSSCSDRLIVCLLEIDSSDEVVGSAIAGCLKSSHDSCVLTRVEMLLKANPEAAKYRDSNGMNLLHLAAYDRKLSPQLCIGVMQQILAVHKDAAREIDPNGWLPVNTAAHDGTVEVMEFLLGLYPESASVVTNRSRNLLHLAVCNRESTTSVMEAKVRYLCTRYPAMILQRDEEGDTPLLDATWHKNIPAMQILCEAGGQEHVRVPVAHLTNANVAYNGWLPLHCLINWNAESLRDSLLSKAADCFRMLLRMYPEGAGIEGGVGAVYKMNPYQLAVDKNLPSYYLRLPLRAAPDLNPAELHRLNYAERRMAMFLAFKAVPSQPKPLLLKRLRFENKDLVKHVISFL